MFQNKDQLALVNWIGQKSNEDEDERDGLVLNPETNFWELPGGNIESHIWQKQTITKWKKAKKPKNDKGGSQ